jgi:hypothetical protein
LRHFGLLTRALAEFYFKSNFVEIKIEDTASQSFDPYNMAIINWTKIGKDAGAIALTGFAFGDHNKFDKSSVALPEGGKKMGGASYFSIAKELSLKESQRQWNSFERLIHARYPKQADEIIFALKKTSCHTDSAIGQ